MNYIIIVLIIIVLAVVIAWQKGYSSSLWFLAAGPLGLLILIFALPDIRKISDSEEKVRKTNRGNRIGTLLSMLSLFAVATNYVSQTMNYDTYAAYTTNPFGSLFLLVFLTGIVSAGIAHNLYTFRNNFTETLGCFGILIALVFVLVILAIATFSIFSTL